jgi:hypothetical protein
MRIGIVLDAYRQAPRIVAVVHVRGNRRHAKRDQ